MTTPERHVIFGTAGHVDHGKSALVLALTGTDPDRLTEEKAREMTIDLGFAFLSLPDLNAEAAIVDVPGHEMFVRNMVAGATGVDAAILIIDAGEGVMPQTVEHLDVLRFLGIADGVIALTKIDKAQPDQIECATRDARELVRDTFLKDARIMPLSALTGEGLDDFRSEMSRIAARVDTRATEGIFRLPVDRVFTLKGVGTVVTGTVISGTLATGESVRCLPQGRDLRVRSLQVHDHPVEQIRAGQRAALNLADIAKQDLHRGDALVTPGSLAGTLMIDARLTLSSRAPRPLAQRTRIRVHHGTKEVMARVVLLDGDTLAQGQSGLVQLRLEAPLVTAKDDAFVIRSYSPMLVIGGGAVVDSHPPKRKRSAGADEVAQRETLSHDETLIAALDKAGARGIDFPQLRIVSGLPEPALRGALDKLSASSHAHAGRRQRWYSAAAVEDVRAAVTARLAECHAAAPLDTFVPLNDAAGAAGAAPEQKECFRIALGMLVEQGHVIAAGQRIRLASHQPQWTGKNADARRIILDACLRAGLAVPLPEELARAAGLDRKECGRVLDALVDADELRFLDKNIYLHPDVFIRCRDTVKAYLLKNRTLTIKQCRDLLGVSRKYLLALLETLDREGLTARQENHRILRRSPPPS